ncbi:MAG: hypothetical protein XU15_C0002G0037 [candidate division NC10 bacterium CSP1-5]|nr:MAG: hypothetical protein XU15_C0002G0037 [candidate division NC10 bacterium CSP1-5]
MVEGSVKRIDPARRLVVIATEEGKEVTLHLGKGSNIEVPEPATGGFMTGSFEYLKEGYWVEVKFTEGDGVCHCTSLSCRS